MQRYSKFNKEEHENAEFLLHAYPELQIAYVEEEPPRKEGGNPRLFSALIDGHSGFDIQTGKRRPRFRIEPPGNPVLGDGKSESQNHAIIFYRGEYLQITSRSTRRPAKVPMLTGGHKDFKKSLVAIVGACRYVFSGNISVSGDLPAGSHKRSVPSSLDLSRGSAGSFIITAPTSSTHVT